MNSRKRIARGVRVLASVAMSTIALLTGGATGAAAAKIPAFAAVEQLPDWSGVWIIPEGAFVDAILHESEPSDPRSPPLSPSYRAVLRMHNLRTRTGKDPEPARPLRTNSERCLPPGMPDVMRYPDAVEFLFTPGRVTLISEEGPLVRRIYTDGRKHRADAEASYNGESIGHWEGATLVVDTTAISNRAQLIGAVHTSGQAHVIEQIHLRDPTHLQIDMVVIDPVALQAPWRYTRLYERIKADFVEYVCLDNNRDRNGEEPDLTPPSTARVP